MPTASQQSKLEEAGNAAERQSAERQGAERQGAERQIVALHLGDEIYGLDIANVSTVLTPQPITPVPNVPGYVRGVMNLRGRIVPVLDLRLRLGLSALGREEPEARIVILDVQGETAGLSVDAVSEVLRLPAASVESPAGLLNTADQACLSGVGRLPNGRLLLLLDAARVLYV